MAYSHSRDPTGRHAMECVSYSTARHIEIGTVSLPASSRNRGVATGWTGVDTSVHPIFPEGVSGIESLWSVLISFRLYPQTLPRLGRGHPSDTHLYCPPHFCLT